MKVNIFLISNSKKKLRRWNKNLKQFSLDFNICSFTRGNEALTEIKKQSNQNPQRVFSIIIDIYLRGVLNCQQLLQQLEVKKNFPRFFVYFVTPHLDDFELDEKISFLGFLADRHVDDGMLGFFQEYINPEVIYNNTSAQQALLEAIIKGEPIKIVRDSWNDI